MKKLDTWLLQELADPNFAHAMLEADGDARLAAQVRTLRKQRGWSQDDLAAAAGMSADEITNIERAQITLLQLTTLRKLARAFDVHISLKFESVVDGAVEVVRYTELDLQVPPRDAELRLYGVHSILPPGF